MVLWIVLWLHLFLICRCMIEDHENSKPNENSGFNTNLNPAIFCQKMISFYVRVLEKQSLEMFYKKLFLKFSQYSQGNICVFTGKDLCWTLFLDSLFKLQTFQAFRPATLFLVCICWDCSAISSVHPKYQTGWSGPIHLQSI